MKEKEKAPAAYIRDEKWSLILFFISKKETVHAPFSLSHVPIPSRLCPCCVPGFALRSEKFSGLRELGLMSSKAANR